ncbi:MAG: transposase [Gaiellaceae bacterium]
MPRGRARRRDDRLRQRLRRARLRRGRRPPRCHRRAPPRRTEPQAGPHLAPIRQRIESVFFTCKDPLSLKRHGARTPRNFSARIAIRLLALAACISLNHQLGRPSRAIADYTA